MAITQQRSGLFSLCSLLMASLFAASASVQLNDPDWYFWLPLYTAASAANILQVVYPSKTGDRIAKLDLGLGAFLFFKVVMEDYEQGIAGFWSLDLSERVVREKTGSALVVASMFLHLKASEISDHPRNTGREQARKYLDYGMVLLVVMSFGLCFLCSVDDMKV